MNRQNAFSPAWGKAVIRTTTTASSRIEFGKGNKSLWVTNQDATDAIYFRVGDSTVEADVTDVYLAPLGSVAITISQDHDYIACEAVANTPSVHAMPGSGL